MLFEAEGNRGENSHGPVGSRLGVFTVRAVRVEKLRLHLRTSLHAGLSPGVHNPLLRLLIDVLPVPEQGVAS